MGVPHGGVLNASALETARLAHQKTIGSVLQWRKLTFSLGRNIVTRLTWAQLGCYSTSRDVSVICLAVCHNDDCML